MATRLFVGNLSFSATEDALRDRFAADGRQVVSVRIVVDRETGRSRGFAFVDMTNDEDAKAAIVALDGVDFGGRALRVSEASERPERPGGGDRAPRREGGGGPPRSANSGPRFSSGGGGGGAPRRFTDAPRGGRPDGRRGPDRIRDDGGGKKPRRPRDDDDDENEWE